MQGTRFYNSAYRGLAQLLVGTNPFADWDVRQRYFEDGYITEQVLLKHKDYARRILIATGLYRVPVSRETWNPYLRNVYWMVC